jgi:hypothetical protein
LTVNVDESLLIQNGRYRSTLCSDSQCCPADGREVPAIDSSRIAIEHVFAGRAMPFANIEALTESISPLVISEDEKWISRMPNLQKSEKQRI